MTKYVVAFVGVLALVPPSFGQWSTSLFVVPGDTVSRRSEMHFDAGFGAGIERDLRRSWSLEGRIWHSSHTGRDVTNVELGARRRFELASRWTPFAGAGVFHRRTDDSRPGRRDHRDTGALGIGGVDFAPVTWGALRLEGRLQIYDSRRTDDVEGVFYASVGWVFRLN